VAISTYGIRSYRRGSSSHSVEGASAINGQRSAGDKGRLSIGEKQYGLCDLQRVRYALHGVAFYLPPEAHRHRGVDHAGAYAVDTNGWRQFGGESPGQIDDAAFRGGVGGHIRGI